MLFCFLAIILHYILAKNISMKFENFYNYIVKYTIFFEDQIFSANFFCFKFLNNLHVQVFFFFLM